MCCVQIYLFLEGAFCEAARCGRRLLSGKLPTQNAPCLRPVEATAEGMYEAKAAFGTESSDPKRAVHTQKPPPISFYV